MKKLARATTACLATCMVLFFYSCDKKSTDELNPDYANFTVEQNKENLQDQGLAVLEKMDAMKAMESASSVQSLMALLNKDEQTQEINYEISKLLAPLAKTDKNVLAVAGLRASDIDANSLSDLFTQRGGVYTYNAAADSFTRVASTSEITFRFPIGESTSNNGTLTINNYTYKVAQNARFEGTEMPKSLNIAIKNGSTTLMSCALTASYDTKDVPKAESTVITFKEGYSFTQAASYDPDKISWDFNLAYNNDKFFQGGFDMDGTLAFDSIANTESEQDFMDRLLNSANASVQLGNIKAVGQVTYAQLLKDQKAFEKKYGNNYDAEPTREQLIEEQCAIMNKNIKANLIYADTKQAIAKITFYRATKQYGEESWPTMEAKAAFDDGTAMDASFFDEGFTELRTAMDTFVKEMMESYGIQDDKIEYPDQPF